MASRMLPIPLGFFTVPDARTAPDARLGAAVAPEAPDLRPGLVVRPRLSAWRRAD